MRVSNKLLSALTLLGILLWIASSSAQTALPITEIRWRRSSDYGKYPALKLTVPDRDTTESAGGGTLRRYDVHVAKMFESTHFLCQQMRSFEGMDWFYEADSGNVDMGRFTISCRLAEQIAIAYGSKHTELTILHHERLHHDHPIETTERYQIPVLNITGGKIARWMDFVQQFRPDFTVTTADAKMPIDRMLQPLRPKIDLPILLFSSRFSASDSLYFSIKADTDQYHAMFAFSPDCTGGNVCYGESIYASRKEHWISSEHAKYYQSVELPHGIKGIASVSCGAYCRSRVQWMYQGAFYTIEGKDRVERYIQAAHEAIATGAR